MLKPVAEFTKASNFLYLFIASIIVGSIFGMDRQVLIKGFLKIFVPLAAGSVVAGAHRGFGPPRRLRRSCLRDAWQDSHQHVSKDASALPASQVGLGWCVEAGELSCSDAGRPGSRHSNSFL
jgi:2-hydroxycarboxylate transporter family